MKGKGWSVTGIRKAKIMEMLNNQFTLSSIATEFGISYKLLAKEMKKAKIDWKAIRMSGLQRMRADIFSSIGSIKDDAKRVEAGLKYLDRYPIVDRDDNSSDVVGSVGSKDKIKDAAMKIMLELGGE